MTFIPPLQSPPPPPPPAPLGLPQKPERWNQCHQHSRTLVRHYLWPVLRQPQESPQAPALHPCFLPQAPVLALKSPPQAQREVGLLLGQISSGHKVCLKQSSGVGEASSEPCSQQIQRTFSNFRNFQTIKGGGCYSYCEIKQNVCNVHPSWMQTFAGSLIPLWFVPGGGADASSATTASITSSTGTGSGSMMAGDTEADEWNAAQLRASQIIVVSSCVCFC